MFWNGDGAERNHEQAAKLWYMSAERGNMSAPARLAKYYFATAIIAAENRVLEEPGSKAVYWGTVATRVDPDPAVRTESQKLVDMLAGVMPSLKLKADAMLAGPPIPGF